MSAKDATLHTMAFNMAMIVIRNASMPCRRKALVTFISAARHVSAGNVSIKKANHIALVLNLTVPTAALMRSQGEGEGEVGRRRGGCKDHPYFHS